MNRSRIGSAVAIAALVVAVGGLALLLLAGPGTRMAWWPFRTGLGLLQYAAYGGPAVAAQQHRAYPDLRPVTLPEPPPRAFERALAVARAQGWEIVESSPAEGRIEATDTTRWFGFKDDVVVRVRPEGAGSRVDVRSLSRVGRSDVGKNAARLRAYLRALGS